MLDRYENENCSKVTTPGGSSASVRLFAELPMTAIYAAAMHLGTILAVDAPDDTKEERWI